MTEERRVFVEDDRPPSGGRAWLAVVAVAVGLAGATFLLSGREPPRGDGQLVQLPAPTISTTTTNAGTMPATTSSTEPPLRLEDWVPSFDRTLTLLTVEDRGLAITTWERGIPPWTVRHDIGRVHDVQFDADGSTFGVVTTANPDRAILWLGHGERVEPVSIDNARIAIAFHNTVGARLAVSSVLDGETRLQTFATVDDVQLVPEEVYFLPGDLEVRGWTDSGFLLSPVDGDGTVVWFREDGTIEELVGTIPPYSGAPLIYAPEPRGPALATVADGEISAVDGETASLSPDRRYAIVGGVYPTELVDLERGFALPLTDDPVLPADWSLDGRWLVSSSPFATRRLGELLTRLVFIDAENGSVVSLWLDPDQIARPDYLVVSG